MELLYYRKQTAISGQLPVLSFQQREENPATSLHTGESLYPASRNPQIFRYAQYDKWGGWITLPFEKGRYRGIFHGFWPIPEWVKGAVWFQLSLNPSLTGREVPASFAMTNGPTASITIPQPLNASHSLSTASNPSYKCGIIDVC